MDLDLLLSTALSAVTLAAYVHTLCPGTPGGDAGELLQVALELGIAHPPGYPLWTMMAHGFSRLPLRNTTAAWRVNLSSAVYGALAAGTLSLGVGSWSGSPWAGVAAGGAFAFSPLVWEYSVQCEHTAVFFGAPFALWALLAGRTALLRPAPLLLLAAAGLAGLSPYLYLVARGGESAAWGSWGETSTAPRTTDAEFGLRLRRFSESLSEELPPYAAPIALLGLFSSFGLLGTGRGGGGRGGGGGGGGGGGAAAAGGGAGGGGGNAASLQDSRGAPVAVAVGAAFALYSLLFLWLANLPASSAFYLQVQRRFWTQPLLLVAAWFGLGRCTGGGRVADCADVPLFDAFGGEVLRALPDKRRVLLLTVGDEVVNSVRYLHRALAVRQRLASSSAFSTPLLTILDLNYAQFRWFVRRAARAGAGFDGVSWPGDAYGSSPGSFLMEQLLDANYDAFEVYVCGGMHPRDESWRRGYQLWPVGLVSQVVRRGTPFDAQEWAARSARALPRLAFARPPQPGSWAEVVARNHYVPAYALRPFALLEAAYAAKGHAAAERALFNAAARLYDETVAVELNGSLRMPEYAVLSLADT
ncbi:hypothetical protein EMIHUDRAFT_459851 [Emiliania huxleyi CCMP1516]|uniref:DUF2723 domain-containing protein n=2 Tax=Emiliania huxleyi TaxID=2903 RepID=A0A0D3IGJ9_EMIH1|nr:hypothetical protein EMIHUDRAFT_459851 [Emiliania huxleyi CCMP1516]EOD10384.1 hypothetical protein EMIHUDRAFT_459851 [Emiliania huxleyi CCMP1516]|eukprot:XP_005762813.1 hypothetical protein EMIHUDRAFT_459851 [Emiliania huxleyi CCMP1516]